MDDAQIEFSGLVFKIKEDCVLRSALCLRDQAFSTRIIVSLQDPQSKGDGGEA